MSGLCNFIVCQNDSFLIITLRMLITITLFCWWPAPEYSQFNSWGVSDNWHDIPLSDYKVSFILRSACTLSSFATSLSFRRQVRWNIDILILWTFPQFASIELLWLALTTVIRPGLTLFGIGLPSQIYFEMLTTSICNSEFNKIA